MNRCRFLITSLTGSLATPFASSLTASVARAATKTMMIFSSILSGRATLV
ncbi:MAG: hypothetical protein ABI076_00650 [Acidobacteriaceae bacterium]